MVSFEAHVRKTSAGKLTIFPIIHLLHLHREFRVALDFSLLCNLTHSHMPDAVSVRQVDGLPMASFRFHLTVDTLAFGYALGATPCARNFHPLYKTSNRYLAFVVFMVQKFTKVV